MYIYIYIYYIGKLNKRRKEIASVGSHGTKSKYSQLNCCGEQRQHLEGNILHSLFQFGGPLMMSLTLESFQLRKDLDSYLADPFGPQKRSLYQNTWNVLKCCPVCRPAAHTFRMHRENLAWTLASAIFWGNMLTYIDYDVDSPSKFVGSTSLPRQFFGQHLWKRVWWLVLATLIF